ncbi:hypothetical protein V6N11_026153 [Hibiscus sabdariffa]|uniref:Uncharacterized protein n=1 Tax=Hibiscus sabdariffa TaxID=183260 RepID=A0ABR2SV62_9ROSI
MVSQRINNEEQAIQYHRANYPAKSPYANYLISASKYTDEHHATHDLSPTRDERTSSLDIHRNLTVSSILYLENKNP